MVILINEKKYIYFKPLSNFLHIRICLYLKVAADNIASEDKDWSHSRSLNDDASINGGNHEDVNTVIHNFGGNVDGIGAKDDDCATDDDFTALEDEIESSACSTPTFNVSSARDNLKNKKVVIIFC